MIANEREYRNSMKALGSEADFQNLMQQQRQRCAADGFTLEEIECLIGPTYCFRAQIQEEVEEYKRTHAPCTPAQREYCARLSQPAECCWLHEEEGERCRWHDA